MQVHCQQRDLRPAVFGGMIRYSLRSAKDIVFSCFFNWGFWRWSLEPRISIVETNIFQATPFYSEFQLLFFQGFGNHRWYTELGILFLLSTVVALLGFCKLPLEYQKITAKNIHPSALRDLLRWTWRFPFLFVAPPNGNQNVYYPEKWLKKHDPSMFNLKWSPFPEGHSSNSFFWGGRQWFQRPNRFFDVYLRMSNACQRS